MCNSKALCIIINGSGLFLQAHFVRVCEMLDHTLGVWKVSVMIGDDQGCRLRVHLSDKVSHSTGNLCAGLNDILKKDSSLLLSDS